MPFAGGEVHGRLCGEGETKGAIDCQLEGGSFADGEPIPTNEVTVLAYNVERGIKWREQLAMLADDPDMRSPDVVLLSEVDRGCSRSGGANVALEYAKALRMNYVYGVEFVELARCLPRRVRVAKACEHGNAIVSRFPIGNVRLIRHAENRSWYSWWQATFRVGEPRLGGRMALAADVKVGERLLRVYAVHFESKGSVYRAAQAAELASDGDGAGGPVVIGGDMNFGAYARELAGEGEDIGAAALVERGYADAHAVLPLDQRYTTPRHGVVDCIFVKGMEVVERRVGTGERWDGVSDHRPIWARLALAS